MNDQYSRHIETGFYMMGTLDVKRLKLFDSLIDFDIKIVHLGQNSFD